MTQRQRTRMDGVAEEVTKEVELSKLVTPKFLTLTRLPANQVAFKVIRSDNGDEPMSQATQPEKTHRRRMRSTQRSSLLFIEFPEGATDDDVKALAEEYGLEDFEVTQTSDGRKCLKRSDLAQMPDNALTVTVDGGKRIGIARADTTPATDPLMPYVEVVAVEFDKSVFADEVAVGEFLQRNDIDFLEKGIENTDKTIRVLRSELQPDSEIRRVEVETGVVAVITRSATQDAVLTPSKFTEVVSEAAYGNYGWGQLDFGAMMADVEFCRAVDDAIWRLSDLFNRILFWSELPVAARKELVSRASTQFSDYIGALLDGLPSKVILVNRSSNGQTKESKMTDSNKTAAQAATQEADNAKAGTTTERTDAQPETVTISRSELAALIDQSVTAALAKRAETEPPAKTTEEAAKATEEQRSDAGNKEVASLEGIAAGMSQIAASVDSLVKRMDSVEGATTVRSDATDDKAEPVKRGDVFSGVFGLRKG